MVKKIRAAFKDTIRVLHTFALEVVGGFFLALAIVGITSIVQEYRRYAAGVEGGIWRVGLTVCFSLAMLAFGIHSFWKSRKVRK